MIIVIMVNLDNNDNYEVNLYSNLSGIGTCSKRFHYDIPGIIQLIDWY